MSCTTAGIIATLKCPSAPPRAIIRPHLSLISDTLAALAIHLQVEDIDRGVLLFWERQVDFDHSVALLLSFGGRLRELSWGSGAVLWKLTLLKPTEQQTAQRVLDACASCILGMFGDPSKPELSGIAITFNAPAAIKFLDAFRLLFLDSSQVPFQTKQASNNQS